MAGRAAIRTRWRARHCCPAVAGRRRRSLALARPMRPTWTGWRGWARATAPRSPPGRERMTEYCRADADGIMAVSPAQLADAFRPLLSDVDSQAFTDELAAFLLDSSPLASPLASMAGSTTTSPTWRRGVSTSRPSGFRCSCGRASRNAWFLPPTDAGCAGRWPAPRAPPYWKGHLMLLKSRRRGLRMARKPAELKPRTSTHCLRAARDSTSASPGTLVWDNRPSDVHETGGTPGSTWVGMRFGHSCAR